MVLRSPRSILSYFLPAMLTLFLMFALVYFYLLPEQYENLVQQKKEQIHGVVDNAWKTIQYEYERFKQGLISERQAQENIFKITEYLRWGPNESNYLYLFTANGRLLAHPYSPDLIGKNLKDVIEGKGRSLGALLLEAANRPDDPFVIYYWYKPNENVMSQKLNCVRTFKPWDWVVGGGVYFDDIDQQHEQQKSRTIIFFLAITIIIGLLLGIMIRRGLLAEELRTQRENQLRASEKKFRDIYDNTSAFIGLLDAEGRLLDANRTSTDFFKC
jgi:signal transduction histidine kinase